MHISGQCGTRANTSKTYSTIACSDSLPLHWLKNDGSSTVEIDRSPRAETITSGVVEFGSMLRFSVIAEGVETSAQREGLLAPSTAT
ncbi:MAG: EAL domain-containing protein [Acidovorax temperans]|uniref:EAL domain-containing protein n=1 Tax=Acidovorax temperans TaxID=80878 RepID=UPI00391A3FEE